jgi:hypothetical protein
MAGALSNPKSPLLPDRMQQGDFFVCDIFDAALKADMASMEHPVFSIATRPDLNIRQYGDRSSLFIEITPSVKGLATVHDRDVLIYCISQCVAALNEGREISRIVRFKAYELLTATNRGTDGRGYEQLKAAMERLRGTTITTNITTGGVEEIDGFGLINRFRIVRETRDGRMQEIEVELSDWVFNAIRSREVLTLHRDYFRLRKPLERRIYEIARKHCGAQPSWSIGLEKLHNKCGSSAKLKEFRRMVTGIIAENKAHGHIPDYDIDLDEGRDMVIFSSRGTVSAQAVTQAPIPPLEGDTYDLARALAPGWDVRMIEQEWRSWATEMPKNPDAAFLGFCRKWYEKRGRP